MILGFDLDGTLAEQDGEMLDAIRGIYSRELKDSLERRYYSTRKPLLDPKQFLGPQDRMVIITGRPLRMFSDTLSWMWKYLGYDILVFFTEEIESGLNLADRYNEPDIFSKVADAKALLIRRERVSVYFEDMEKMVEALRKRLPDIPVIQFQGRPKEADIFYPVGEYPNINTVLQPFDRRVAEVCNVSDWLENY